MKNKVKLVRVDEDARQTEAAKTNRLRALRLAKEAADKEAAALAAASQPPKASRARAAR